MAHHDSRQQVGSIDPSQSDSPLGQAALVVALAVPFVLSAVLMGSLLHAVTFWLALVLFLLPGWLAAGKWFSGYQRMLIGAPLGYFLTSMLATLHIRGGSGVLATLVLFLVLVFLCHRIGRATIGGEETAAVRAKNELFFLAVGLSFGWILCTLPFLNVGAAVADGVAYRAYFSADLMTHLSVVAEIQRGAFPLVDPFHSEQSLGYYWLFFVFPAWVGLAAPNQGVLLSLYLAGGLSFTGLAYVLGCRLGASPAASCFATIIGIGFVSYEGLVALVRLGLSGESFGAFTDMNVDALARWVYELSSLDGLHRSLMYTPQHLFSYSCLLVLLIVLSREELVPKGFGSSVLVGLLLGAMAGTSIVTAMIAGPWLVVTEGFQSFKAGGLARWFGRWTVIGFVSLSCLGWFAYLGFFGGASSSLTFRNPSFGEFFVWLALDMGVLTLLICWCWIRARKSRPSADLTMGQLFELFLLALPLALFADLEGYEGIWMVWRAGSVMLVAGLASLFIAFARGMPRWAVLVIIAPASLTLLMDVYNAQDIQNRNLSAGEFPWTLVVPSDEIDALRFIREETPKDALVQWDVRARGPAEWALIPALAERRMAVGFPIFLLDVTKYRVRERRATRRIFTSGNELQAHDLATAAGIDYILVGRREIEVRGPLVQALWRDAERFLPVFSQGEVTVLQVLDREEPSAPAQRGVLQPMVGPRDTKGRLQPERRPSPRLRPGLADRLRPPGFVESRRSEAEAEARRRRRTAK